MQNEQEKFYQVIGKFIAAVIVTGILIFAAVAFWKGLIWLVHL